MNENEVKIINGHKVCDDTARDMINNLNIPTKVSELANDSSFATEIYVTNKIAEAQLGGGEVDLSGYVTKEIGNASQISFSDGETFQAKLDAGTLKGEKGDTGEQGPQGIQGDTGPQGPKGDTGLQGPAGNDGYTPIKGVDYFDGAKGDKGDKGEQGPQGIQGEQGPAGNDGLTTAISVNGTQYTHVEGTITLPNYPSVPTKTSDLTNDSGFITANDIPSSSEIPATDAEIEEMLNSIFGI